MSRSLAEGEEAPDGEAEDSVSEVVFEPKETVPNRKYLVFSRSSNFTVSLKYTNPEVMSPDTETDIGVYNLTGVNKCEKFNTTDKPKMTEGHRSLTMVTRLKMPDPMDIMTMNMLKISP